MIVFGGMNLNGLIQLAELGRKNGVDLWNFETEDGRGLRKAVDYLRPFARAETPWPHPQLGKVTPESLDWALRVAAARYPEWIGSKEVTRSVPPDSRQRLTTPFAD